VSDITQDLLHIAVGHLLPANPKKYAWVSAVETGPYHIETNDSAANGGQGFKAICGAAGDFNCHLTAGRIFPSQKCKVCVELATKGISEVADKATGIAPDTDSPIVSNPGVSTSARVDAPEVSHFYLLSSEIVSLVEADRRVIETELAEVGQ
jgi:hypothetical protein